VVLDNESYPDIVHEQVPTGPAALLQNTGSNMVKTQSKVSDENAQQEKLEDKSKSQQAELENEVVRAKLNETSSKMLNL